MSHTIPQPPAIPWLGNVTNVEKQVPQRSFNLLADQYGEIYKLNLLGRKVVVANSYALCAEISDDKRFEKALGGGLREVRHLIHDGLFTAENGEHNWGVAHRLLMPAFGTASIRGMFHDMEDIVAQLVKKWERFGPDHVINPAEDFTRLTLDAITLCSMGYRLNSFYMEHPHPFAQAMFDFLVESSARANRPSLVHAFMKQTQLKYEEDMKLMNELAFSIVDERKANPVDKNDLLNLMLLGKDPKTGESMTRQSIVDNFITFMIAGHETTSGMLTFVMYHLGKNPDALAKLRAEIDEVLGDQPIQLTDIPKMPYVVAVMREALRLHPTAPMRSAKCLEPTTLGNGKYAITPDEILVVNNIYMHHDHAVWGDDADEFKPERMLDGKFEALPPNAWQPFGYGARGCIGRAFAWQEAHMAIATIYQKFDIVFTDPGYMLQLKQALTIKPDNFFVRALPRSKTPRLYAQPSSDLLNSRETATKIDKVAPVTTAANSSNQPLYVLYGSNTGTSEAFAQRIATDAPAHGFKATMGTLDSAAEHLPTDGPVIVVTASFEGEPADNAAYFVKWLSNLKGDELSNVRYAVFGCGNHDWVSTYQRIPQLVDRLLGERGGKPLVPRGEGDAGGADLFQDFDDWEIKLFQTLSEEYKTTASAPAAMLSITTVDPGISRAVTLRQSDAALGEVIENKVLSAPGKPVKRHIEFELPEGQEYRAGDYLAVLPINPTRDVSRVLSHFKLSGEQEITLSSTGPTALPVGRPISLTTLLSGYVEISQPATPRNLRGLISAETEGSKAVKVLEALASSYAEEVLSKRLSILDILETHQDIKLPFGTYLEMLPPMRIRQYSISSSPLWNPQHVTLTISVLNAPAISGREETFMGVASNYIDNLKPGDKVQMAIRPSAAFHLPTDPTIPVVMFCAGSGIAPMRGFIQERALQQKSGREVGKMLLFFGCRSPKEDFLYSDSDLSEWIQSGILDVRPAFSRSSDDSAGCKYVQNRVWEDRADIVGLFNNKAKLYVCGSGKVASGIKEKLLGIIAEHEGVDLEEASVRMERISQASRFATDVFE